MLRIWGRALTHCLWECELAHPLWELEYRFLKTQKIQLLYDPDLQFCIKVDQIINKTKLLLVRRSFNDINTVVGTCLFFSRIVATKNVFK